MLNLESVSRVARSTKLPVSQLDLAGDAGAEGVGDAGVAGDHVAALVSGGGGDVGVGDAVEGGLGDEAGAQGVAGEGAGVGDAIEVERGDAGGGGGVLDELGDVLGV